MDDNTRLLAVERATQAHHEAINCRATNKKSWTHVAPHVQQQLIEIMDEAIDASGLVQKVERSREDADHLREQLAAARADFDAKVEDLAFANRAWRDTYEQLAAERALCDRLAFQYHLHRSYSCWYEADDVVLADYDTTRAAR